MDIGTSLDARMREGVASPIAFLWENSMAYLILVIGILYSIAWAAGLSFSLKSSGEKSPWIPALGLIAFVGLSVMSGLAAKDAMDAPEQITASGYTSLSFNMTPDEVAAVLGAPEVDPQRERFDLAGRGVTIPSVVGARLPSGENLAEALSAKLVITISGEASRRGAWGKLGAKANNEGGGVAGLQLVLKENDNETTFTEGEEWTYENGDTPEIVAKKIGEAIDAHPSWNAEGSTEEAPTKVIISPELEENFGDAGNKLEGWVATGPNTGVKVGIMDDGSPQRFRGGMDSALLQFWFEKEAVLDGNFTMTDRLVLVGFIDDKLKAIRQSGIDLTAAQIAALDDALEEARAAEEEAMNQEDA